MYGPEYEIIKEYEPYVKESKEIENILDNNIEELIDIKYNKPEKSTKDKISKDKEEIKEKKEENLKKLKALKPINTIKMFGSEYEYIKEYKPTESEIIETKQLKENVIDELLDSKQNKPIIKDKN